MRRYNSKDKSLTERQNSSSYFAESNSEAAKMIMPNDKLVKDVRSDFWSRVIQSYSDYLIRY